MAKYADIYFKQGFDVLVTWNTTMQTFWPKRTMVGFRFDFLFTQTDFV
jgi:hypothetical protein